MTAFTGLDAIYGDSLLDRILSLSQMPVEGRLNWITWAKSTLYERKHELAEGSNLIAGSYEDLFRKANISVIDIQLFWLDQLYDQISAERSPKSRERNCG